MTLNLYTDPTKVIEKIKYLSPHTKTHNTSVSERKNVHCFSLRKNNFYRSFFKKYILYFKKLIIHLNALAKN